MALTCNHSVNQPYQSCKFDTHVTDFTRSMCLLISGDCAYVIQYQRGRFAHPRVTSWHIQSNDEKYRVPQLRPRSIDWLRRWITDRYEWLCIWMLPCLHNIRGTPILLIAIYLRFSGKGSVLPLYIQSWSGAVIVVEARINMMYELFLEYIDIVVL